MRPHPRPYAHPQLLTVALCLFLLLGSDLARVTAQLMPFAVGQTDGTLTIFTVNEIEGTVRPEIKGVRFLPIYLAGHAQRLNPSRLGDAGQRRRFAEELGNHGVVAGAVAD